MQQVGTEIQSQQVKFLTESEKHEAIIHINSLQQIIIAAYSSHASFPHKIRAGNTPTKPLPEDAHRSVRGHLNIGLIHKHSLETGVRIAACQDLLVEFKYFMQVGHGVLEKRQQLWQAEMGHLQRTTGFS